MRSSDSLRARVLAGEWIAGTFLKLGSPVTVEVAGYTFVALGSDGAAVGGGLLQFHAELRKS